jgi:hypothetical protein
MDTIKDLKVTMRAINDDKPMESLAGHAYFHP